jgi:hypothetical protein
MQIQFDENHGRSHNVQARHVVSVAPAHSAVTPQSALNTARARRTDLSATASRGSYSRAPSAGAARSSGIRAPAPALEGLMTVKRFCRMLLPLALATALAAAVTSNAQAATDSARGVSAQAALPVPPITVKPIMTFARRQLSRPVWRTALDRFRLVKSYYDEMRAAKAYYDRLMWYWRARRAYCAIVYDMFGSDASWRYWAQYYRAARQSYLYCSY